MHLQFYFCTSTTKHFVYFLFAFYTNSPYNHIHTKRRKRNQSTECKTLLHSLNWVHLENVGVNGGRDRLRSLKIFTRDYGQIRDDWFGIESQLRKGGPVLAHKLLMLRWLRLIPPSTRITASRIPITCSKSGWLHNIVPGNNWPLRKRPAIDVPTAFSLIGQSRLLQTRFPGSIERSPRALHFH